MKDGFRRLLHKRGVGGIKNSQKMKFAFFDCFYIVPPLKKKSHYNIKIFFIALCSIICIYIFGSCFVIDEKIKYGNGFKVVIQEKLFPSIFYKLIPGSLGDGAHGIWEVRVIFDEKKLGPFHTSWLEGIDIREDSVRIYDTSKEIIIDVNQQ